MNSLRYRARASASVEVLVSLLALAPFLVCIPLLGKQLDIKHKTYDAARYSVWERTIWSDRGSSHDKTEEDVSLESRDRVLGDPRSGLIPLPALREQGLSENPLWVDASHRRLVSERAANASIDLVLDDDRPPMAIGNELVVGVAHGEGRIGRIAESLQLGNLSLNRGGFATASIAVGIRALIPARAARLSTFGASHARHGDRELVHRATAAILSDTWTVRDEHALGRRVDDVTTNEAIEELERPGRLLGMQARGKGQPLYGEGQYGWDPDLRPRSTALPATYIRRR